MRPTPHAWSRGLLFACCLGAVLFALGGCAGKVGGERVILNSADPVFVDELLADDAMPKRRIFGWLQRPKSGSSGPTPAMVLLHTSFGQGVHDQQRVVSPPSMPPWNPCATHSSGTENPSQPMSPITPGAACVF